MSTDSSSDRDPVERLAEEFLDRLRRGEQTSPDEYADRYPEWAERILEAFPALELMERLKPGSGDRTGSLGGGAGTGEVPERLGEYRILREVGHGGMGVVYEAVQESLGRHVALKVLPLHGRIDAVQMERFRLEARSAGRLHHTHIVPVHGLGHHDGVHFYAMQFIQGCGLDAVIDDLRRLRSGEAPGLPTEAAATPRLDSNSLAVAESLLAGRSPIAQGGSRPGSSSTQSDVSGLSGGAEPGYYHSVARIGVQVADALAHAHEQGVLHRDIKPSNLLLDADGQAWVTDFGLAKLEGSDGPTRTGDVVGTLRYMAPERFEGWSDPRSDVYGLGMTLYEMLTLHPAYEAATRARLIERVLHTVPTAPRKIDPRIPRDLETIVQKAIAKEPAERYTTARALADDLTNFLAGKPIRARRVGAAERAWRWCGRNPSAAGLLGVSLVAAMALVGGVVGWVDNSRVRAALNEKERALNFDRVILAERELINNNVGRAEELIDGVPGFHGWEWHYLKRQCHTDLMTIKVPETQGMGIAMSPDDRYIATTSDDLLVRVWNIQTGICEQPLDGLTGDMCDGLAYSPDGSLLAASSGAGTEPGNFIVWETATWSQVLNIAGMCGESSSVAFSRDSNRLAVVSGEWNKPPTLTIWDLKTKKKLVEQNGRTREMGWISVAFSPDGESVAVASGKLDQEATENEPGEVTIRSSFTGLPIGSLSHPAPLTCVAYSPNGDWIATTAHDRVLRIWDARDRKKLRELRGHNEVSFKVAFSPNGQLLADVSDDNSARIWETANFEEILTLRGHAREVHALAFSHDSQRLATSSWDATVKLWDARAAKNPVTLNVQRDWVKGVSFNANGSRIATAGMDKRARVHDLASPTKKPREFAELADPIWCVAYSPVENVIATGSGHWKNPTGPLGQITLWDAETGVQRWTRSAHAGLVRSLAFSLNGRRLATTGGENNSGPGLVKVWDVTTGDEIMTLECPESLARGLICLAYSPDGRFVAAGGFEGLVIVWDTQTRRVICKINTDCRMIFGLAFNSKGTRLAWTGDNGKVRISDTTTGEKVSEFLGHKSMVWCITFSPDDSRMVSGGDDGTVKVWDPKTGLEALTLRGHNGSITHVSFSPDGYRIASSSKDGTVRIWDGSPWDSHSTSNGQASAVR